MRKTRTKTVAGAASVTTETCHSREYTFEVSPIPTPSRQKAYIHTYHTTTTTTTQIFIHVPRTVFQALSTGNQNPFLYYMCLTDGEEFDRPS